MLCSILKNEKAVLFTSDIIFFSQVKETLLKRHSDQ
ncbi:hypothetical protein PGTDC60_0278 [Porphyromonas gingivalis TDC60]|nr:hypothetical protein SJDPG11_04545 [Porphyromonas gingivalis SJD11]BAK24448.1 hypothetical protein PGTDC60_0278 [Porphyromonas gingivalis TDC60]